MKREGFLALTGGDVAKPQIGSLAARSELQNADDPLPPLRGGLSVTGREAWIAAAAADVLRAAPAFALLATTSARQWG
jgi:hypothetical protein